MRRVGKARSGGGKEGGRRGSERGDSGGGSEGGGEEAERREGGRWAHAMPEPGIPRISRLGGPDISGDASSLCPASGDGEERCRTTPSLRPRASEKENVRRRVGDEEEEEEKEAEGKRT